MPNYLLRIFKDYLRNRSLLYETLEDQRRMEVTSGVAQGSILGPDFWKATYDSLLKLDMPEKWRLVGYTDDVVELVAGRPVEQAQSRFGILMRQVNVWMTTDGFNLALEKTKVIILTKKRIPTLFPISFGESIIESKQRAKYLELTLDSKMNFFCANQSSSEQGSSWCFGIK